MCSYFGDTTLIFRNLLGITLGALGLLLILVGFLADSRLIIFGAVAIVVGQIIRGDSDIRSITLVKSITSDKVQVMQTLTESIFRRAFPDTITLETREFKRDGTARTTYNLLSIVDRKKKKTEPLRLLGYAIETVDGHYSEISNSAESELTHRFKVEEKAKSFIDIYVHFEEMAKTGMKIV